MTKVLILAALLALIFSGTGVFGLIRVERRINNNNNNITAHRRSPRSTRGVTCGFQSTLYVRGEDTSPTDGEFPWIAAIYKISNSGSDEFHCTGSLIHPKVVLTASHCVASKKPSALTVVVNGKVKFSPKQSAPEEKGGVLEIIKHPKYNSGARRNDAALLILEKPFALEGQSLVNILCLPPDTFDLENTKCLVAGWGKDYTGQSTQRMKKATVPFVNRDQCETFLRNTRLGQQFVLDKSFLCAGGEEGKGACTGSGGSPLMCAIPSWSTQYSQVGIVSWGIDCGRKNVPEVYTSVKEIAEWINSELLDRNLMI